MKNRFLQVLLTSTVLTFSTTNFVFADNSPTVNILVKNDVSSVVQSVMPGIVTVIMATHHPVAEEHDGKDDEQNNVSPKDVV